MTNAKLVKELEVVIREITEVLDKNYRMIKVIENWQDELATKLKSLYEASLFVYTIYGDAMTLYHILLSSSSPYEQRYAEAKIYPLINEGFKKLYGFHRKNKNGEVGADKGTYWSFFNELKPIMEEEDLRLFYQVSSELASVSLTSSWWKTIRDGETHLDIVHMYEFRKSINTMDQAIVDFKAFFRLMHITSGFIQLLINRLASKVKHETCVFPSYL